MATNGTRSIKDMVRGQVADETREWFRVTDDATVLAAVDAYTAWVAWSTYNADQAAWALENPDTDPPQETTFAYPAAVADRANITDKEGIFVELRFFATHTDPNEKILPVNVGWLQVTENVDGLSAGFFNDLLTIFNTLRALTPYAPVV